MTTILSSTAASISELSAVSVAVANKGNEKVIVSKCIGYFGKPFSLNLQVC
jgi:sialic acid synthase SpsE